MVMGLDLATHKSGCCLMDNENLVHYECIFSCDSEDFRDRIHSICKRIKELLVEYKPSMVYIEDAPIIKNSSASMLCVMQGYVICILDRLEISYEIFKPSSWRKTIGIVGNNGKLALEKDFVKQATIDYVNQRFLLNLEYKKGSKKSQDDIADSIGIACCGIMRDKNGKKNI